MGSTSPEDLAAKILAACLGGQQVDQQHVDQLAAQATSNDPNLARRATRTLFADLVEPLADRFEPALCWWYARVFSRIVEQTAPGLRASSMIDRYERIRRPRVFHGVEPVRVCVLSRVTLGADVAVTSAVIAAAKQRFPAASIDLIGPAKNAELFAADRRVVPRTLAYGRSGLLTDRLASAELVREIIGDDANTIVIDPDSRLSQLGLMPVCEDSRYFFFESRSYGSSSDKALPRLTSDWMTATFGTSHVNSFVALPAVAKPADITISLGVGDNEDKRLGDEFELELLNSLVKTGKSVLIDRGAGETEAERIDALYDRCRSDGSIEVHDGSFASFAGHIAQSKLYVGYDSAGQHVASAAGVPLLSIFAGYVSDRMFARWRPVQSETTHVLDATDVPVEKVLLEARTLIERWAARTGERRPLER